MRRSKSLRGIHLSCNPGLTPKLVDYLKKRIHSIDEQEINTIDFRKLPSILQLREEEREDTKVDCYHTNLNKSGGIQSQRKECNRHGGMQKEIMQVKQISMYKRIEQNETQAQTIA